MTSGQQQEDSPLINEGHEHNGDAKRMELADKSSSYIGDINATASSSSSQPTSSSSMRAISLKATIAIISVIAVYAGFHAVRHVQVEPRVELVPTGPYSLVELQEGAEFFSFYDFYDGPDSLGSAGHNAYVSRSRAVELGIAGVVAEADPRTGEEREFAYMSSAPTEEGPRDSVRLEGRTRFDRGLFVLDVRHMPDGCGVWPAFWMTDEADWPNNGEVDVLEGVNGQTVAKTALHTSDHCDMYAHVPPYAKTGDWEWITGIPETFTGEPDFRTAKPADNCWALAPHQWYNEGCTVVHERNDTLGAPVNENGGGVYAFEWDPENGYMKSWAFSPDVPENLLDAIGSAGLGDPSRRVAPDPGSWGLPYAYFAVGDATGCSADHFKHMRIVFNLAFCGNVSGNRFSRECAALTERFGVADDGGRNDPVSTCNAYIDSNPEALEEAYWKIRGVYVYERQLEEKEETAREY